MGFYFLTAINTLQKEKTVFVSIETHRITVVNIKTWLRKYIQSLFRYFLCVVESFSLFLTREGNIGTSDVIVRIIKYILE